MTEETPRLRLPLLAPGQAQKEMTHNEALVRLDLIAAASVLSVAAIAPQSPVAGQCWIVGEAPVGDWAGRGDAIAGWTEGGWRFVSPRIGMLVWIEDEGCLARYTATGWVIGAPLGNPQPAVPNPTGGTTVDAEARAALEIIITRLQHFGLLIAA